MLLAEKYQILLLQNTNRRPPGTVQPQTQSETHFNNWRRGSSTSFRGRGSSRGRNNFRGRGNSFQQRGRSSTRGGRGRGRSNPGRFQHNWTSNNNNSDKFDNPPTCHRCRTKGHFKKACRALAHLVALYQKNQSTTEYETHGAFLETPEILPELYLVTQLDISKDLHGHNCCILDSGTSHTIL